MEFFTIGGWEEDIFYQNTIPKNCYLLQNIENKIIKITYIVIPVKNLDDDLICMSYYCAQKRGHKMFRKRETTDNCGKNCIVK